MTFLFPSSMTLSLPCDRVLIVLIVNFINFCYNVKRISCIVAVRHNNESGGSLYSFLLRCASHNTRCKLMKEILWHNLTVQQALKELKSSVLGLTADEVSRLKIKHGFNQLPRQKPLTGVEILFNQFKSVLVYVLIIAGCLSIFLGEAIDASVIFAAVLINVVVGFFQENKAQNALEKLRQLVNPESKIIRAGVVSLILAKDLVPGDVIVVEMGDKVPADARLIESKELITVEAALTGEPQTVEKSSDVLDKGKILAERFNMLYMGTTISQGRGTAVIVATGVQTQLGKIARLVRDVKEEPTPLQKKLNAFSRHLSVFILCLSALLFGVGVLRGNSVLMMFNTAVAVAVAAIPEGLVVAVTVILAVGMQRILKKKALVRKLVAAETLGSTTVICTDKTGTLTEGEMRVVEIVTNSQKFTLMTELSQVSPVGRSESFALIKIGMLCNNAIIQAAGPDLRDWKILGSSTEKALMLAGGQMGLKVSELLKDQPRLDEIMFDSASKYMATLHQADKGRRLIYFKGAPELILASAIKVQIGDHQERIYQPKRKELREKYERLSREGLRVLAFAYKEVDLDVEHFKGLDRPLSEVTLVGFVGIKDPLRPDVKETLAATAKSGLKTVIITGDNKLTARAIAKELGLDIRDENILEGKELAKMNDQELERQVRNIKIYARVTPEDKLRIVQAWQKQNEVVAMTGDGINDAPALKRADIGVALGSGTDVAKEAANLVLLDNSYKTIIGAIEQGRIIYDNIKKVTLYLLSDSFSEIIIIFGSLFLGLPLPLLPTQILWINLVTDGFPNVALTVEPGEKEVMRESPQERNKSILDGERRLLIAAISLVTGLSSLALFYYFYKIAGDIALARTVVFVALGLDSLLYVFSCRTLRHSIFHSNFFRNKILLLAIVIGALLQLSAIYIPFFQRILQTVALGLSEWLVILSVCAVVIIMIEVMKWIFIARHKAHSA